MKRDLGIDWLRLMLAVMVVALHAEIFSEISSFYSHLFVNGILRIAVPCFFIVNGYYLLDAFASRSSMAVWLKRLTSMYVFWMLIYLPFYFPFDAVNLSALKALCYTIFFGYYHLWYLAGLICAGSILYLIRNLASVWLILLALILFFFGVACQYYSIYADVPVSLWRYRNFLFFAFPLLSAGILIRRFGPINFSYAAILFFLCVGLILLFVESVAAYRFHGAYTRVDIFFSLIIVGPAIFLFVKKLSIHGQGATLAKLSQSIYFSHVFLLLLLLKNAGLSNGTVLFVLVLLGSLSIYLPIASIAKRVKFIL